MGRVNEDLIALLRYARFRTTGLRVGYDVEEVDDFIDQLSAALARGEHVAGLVERTRFTTVKRKGYEMSEVDALLDRIAGRPTGRALKNTLDPIAEPREATSGQSSEIVQEQVGFLGRLRGRRG
jgi:DivIVA domain-containing protein